MQESMHKTQAAEVAQAFDNVAEVFESRLENEITRNLRARVYRTVGSLIPSGGSILDINCGIGIDALELAVQGYHVTGIDIASKMIEEARKRAAKFQTNHAKFFVASFEDLSPLRPNSFDLVLSNFGGLNCVERLEPVTRQIASVTRQDGYFLGVFMPPHCLWEIVAGLARLNFRSAFRRFNKRAFASGFQGHTFQVFYHSPFSFSRQLDRWFRVEHIQSFNIFSPPPHAVHFQRSNPYLSAFLQRVDGLVGSFPVFRSIGDHTLIVARRR